MLCTAQEEHAQEQHSRKLISSSSAESRAEESIPVPSSQSGLGNQNAVVVLILRVVILVLVVAVVMVVLLLLLLWLLLPSLQVVMIATCVAFPQKLLQAMPQAGLHIPSTRGRNDRGGGRIHTSGSRTEHPYS